MEFNGGFVYKLLLTLCGFMYPVDVTEVLTNFIAQYIEGLKGDGSRPFHREYTDMISLERSYRTMEYLIKVFLVERAFVEKKIKCIFSGLFNIFKPEALGNFFHAHKVITHLLTHPESATDAIAEILALPRESAILPFLNNLHEPPVLDIFVACAQCSCDASLRRRFYHLIHECSYLSVLAGYLCCPAPSPFQIESVFAGGDIVNRIVDLEVEQQSKLLFWDVASLYRLVDAICEAILKGSAGDDSEGKTSLNPNCPVKQTLFECLMKILKSSREVFLHRASGGNGPKFEVNFLGKHLSLQIGAFSNLILKSFQGKSVSEVKLAGFKVASFGVWRMTCIELIYQLLANCSDQEAQASALNSVPGPFWKLLVNNFFEYKHNNMFHVLFYRITVWLLKTGHEQSLKQFISKPKLLSKMIEHYKMKKFDGAFRGYILFICIALKLTLLQQSGNISAGSYVKDVLDHHHMWKEFQEDIDDGVRHLLRGSDCVKSNDINVRSKAYLGPLVTPVDETMLNRVNLHSDTDLKSPIAMYLGFLPKEDDHHAMPETRSEKEEKSEVKGGIELDIDQLSDWIDSSGKEQGKTSPIKGGSNKKKKKKRK